MKEILINFTIGLLTLLLGLMIGYNIKQKEPPNLTSEIISLQKDVLRLEAGIAENLIKINYLEYWRDSVVYRPEKKPTPPKR